MRLRKANVLSLLLAAMPCIASADAGDAANFRNAVELGAYQNVCRGQVADILEAYTNFATYSGEYSRSQIKKAIRQRSREVTKSRDFCRKTRENIPNFRAAIENNDPVMNPAVPARVVSRAEADCKAVIFRRDTDRERKLYEECVQQQIDLWKLQKRHKG